MGGEGVIWVPGGLVAECSKGEDLGEVREAAVLVQAVGWLVP